MDEPNQPKITILRRRQVEQRVGLQRSAIYERIAQGTFPRPVPLGARAVGWVASEIDDWLQARVNEARVSDDGPTSKRAA